MSKEREYAFYWVKIYNRWVVAEWYPSVNCFFRCNDCRPYREHEILEIDETPIKRNKP